MTVRRGNPIIIVQGGQWGSEAKGAITGWLCKNEGVDVAVRTGATNAGHTVIYNGRAVKMQQLPVGWVNPDTELVLGAGALIDPEILEREVALVTELTGRPVKKRLFIDYRAGLHLPVHMDRSKLSGRHHKIGATGKGSSEALIDKIRGRGEGYKVFGESEYGNNYQCIDTVKALNDQYDQGAKILLEGTQGTLLDLHVGPYPYTTHKQTLPAVWMAEAGLSPSLDIDVVMVVRTYPIRVAGNSGPMPAEISWPILADMIGTKRGRAMMPPILDNLAVDAFEQAVRAVSAEWSARGSMPESNGLDQHTWTPKDRVAFMAALSEVNAEALKRLTPATVEELSKLFELTTVTKKLRRVASMSWTQLYRAAQLCRPHRVALTFMNYEFPEHWYEVPEPGWDKTGEYRTPMGRYVDRVVETCNAPVRLMTFGPADEHVLVC